MHGKGFENRCDLNADNRSYIDDYGIGVLISYHLIISQHVPVAKQMRLVVKQHSLLIAYARRRRFERNI